MTSAVQLAERFEHEIAPIKASRFICELLPAADAEAVIERQRELRAAHPRCRHVCYAWVGAAENDARFSDDGEPAKTAGLPMVQALLGHSVRHSGALVVRYFGGTKLGTGGLVRAYSAAVRETLRLAPLHPVIEMHPVHLRVPFSAEAAVRRELERAQARELSADYSSLVDLRCRVPKVNMAGLQSLIEQFGGSG